MLSLLLFNLILALLFACLFVGWLGLVLVFGFVCSLKERTRGPFLRPGVPWCSCFAVNLLCYKNNNKLLFFSNFFFVCWSSKFCLFCFLFFFLVCFLLFPVLWGSFVLLFLFFLLMIVSFCSVFCWLYVLLFCWMKGLICYLFDCYFISLFVCLCCLLLGGDVLWVWLILYWFKI